jgi:hypothetical protein
VRSPANPDIDDEYAQLLAEFFTLLTNGTNIHYIEDGCIYNKYSCDTSDEYAAKDCWPIILGVESLIKEVTLDWPKEIAGWRDFYRGMFGYEPMTNRKVMEAMVACMKMKG